MAKHDTESKLKELGIENYSISEDGSVCVNGTVDISFKGLTEIPVQFGVVKGDFNCSNNKLESLAGAPQSVGVSFFCHSNRLASLAGGPDYVGKAYVCKGNRLTSLEGSPQAINGSFDCSNNDMTSLEGGPRSVSGSFDCSGNKLETLEGIPIYVEMVLYCNNNPLTADVVAAFRKASSFLIISDVDD